MVLLRNPNAASHDLFDGAAVNAENVCDSLQLGPIAACDSRPRCIVKRQFCGTTIPGLCGAIGPRAIALRVRQFVVATLKRHAVRLFSHVSDELPRIVPIIADRYPSSTVDRIRLIGLGVATTHHVLPSLIQRMLLTAMSIGVIVGAAKRVLGMSLNLVWTTISFPSGPMLLAPAARLTRMFAAINRARKLHGYHHNVTRCRVQWSYQ